MVVGKPAYAVIPKHERRRVKGYTRGLCGLASYSAAYCFRVSCMVRGCVVHAYRAGRIFRWFVCVHEALWTRGSYTVFGVAQEYSLRELGLWSWRGFAGGLVG